MDKEQFKQRNHTRFTCRCRSCNARRTLAKHPDDYIRQPLCDCGGTYLVDWYRMREEFKHNTCRCDGYPYPHNKNTSVWCIQHPTGPTEEQYKERYGD